MLIPILVDGDLIHKINVRDRFGSMCNATKNGQNKCPYNIYPVSLVFQMVDGSLETYSRGSTDVQAKLIVFLHACLLNFMCFLISSFATEMCLHNGYANITHAFPTATPTGTKQPAVAPGTDMPNGHITALEDKTEGRVGVWRRSFGMG